jgi:FtsH-binding integral membrane protein
LRTRLLSDRHYTIPARQMSEAQVNKFQQIVAFAMVIGLAATGISALVVLAAVLISSAVTRH